jgi:signal transduction histidine kinase
LTDRLVLLSHELRSPVAALGALAERAALPGLPAEARAQLLALAIAAGRDIERLLSDPDVVSARPTVTDVESLVAGLEAPLVSVAAERAAVLCDATRIRQALGNLVANGLRHGNTVSVDARVDGGSLVITVADDGPGVDPTIDPFARGVSAAGSTGYGLWIARAVAEAHGGSLELRPAPGGTGAVFTLVLPLASAAQG